MADKYDNHTFETATDLGADLTINTECGTVGDATLGTAGEQDYYSFTLNKAAYVTLTTSGAAGGDTIMYLYNEDGEQIASDDNGGEDSYSKISNALLHSGTYYVMVKADEGTTIDEYSLAANVVMTIVTTAADVVDPEDGATSLREAVSYTELIDDEHPVTFAGDFEIKLDKTLDISANTTIDGEDNAITITGPDVDKTFYSNAELTLRNLTVEAAETDTTAGETAIVNARTGANVNGFTFAAGGKLRIYEDGEANDTTVDGGKLYIYEGGAASATTLSAGNFYVSAGGAANDTVVDGGALLVYEDGEATTTTLNDGLMTVSGSAYDTTVNDGTLEVAGSANFTSVYGGTMNVAGEAADTSVYGGAMTVSDSGAAYDTCVTSGILDVRGVADGITADADATVAILANGTAESVTVNENATVSIESDGAAGDVTVNWHGELYVSAGGAANDITENGGYVYVADEAEATFVANTFGDLTLADGWSATAHSGTVAEDITIDDGGALYVFDGGEANRACVTGGYLEVGGTANDTGVYGFVDEYDNPVYGSMYLDGAANDTTVGEYGRLEVASDGEAKYTTVDYGELTVYGAANNTDVYGYYDAVNGIARGIMTVNAGATVNNTCVEDGFLTVYGTANNNTVYGYYDADNDIAYGAMTVNAGATANTTTVYDGYLVIRGVTNNTTVSESFTDIIGGIANNTAVSGYYYEDTDEVAYGTISVSGNGTANGTTVDQYGILLVADDGIVNNTTVNEGRAFVGGIANATTVNERGELYVLDGGSAAKITENGGYVEVVDGATATFVANTFSDLTLADGRSATAHSGTVAENIAIGDGGALHVFDGGEANDASVDENGVLNVYAGGAANGAAVNENGEFYVYEDGVASATTVDGGYFRVYGAADATTVDGDGNMIVDGAACDTAIDNGVVEVYGSVDTTVVNENGELYVYAGGEASATTVDGGYFEVSGDADATTVDGDGSMAVYGTARGTTIDNGAVEVYGSADTTVVNENGYLEVAVGGTVSATTVDAGSLIVSGAAIATTVDGDGVAEVYGAADTTTVNAGSMTVFGTADATTVNEDGYVEVAEGGTTYGTTVNVGNFEVAGTANDTTVNGRYDEENEEAVFGLMSVGENGAANGVTLNEYSDLTVDGKADGITVNGRAELHVLDGGSATAITENGGYVEVADGASATFVANVMNNLDLMWKATLHSGTIANNTAVGEGGELYVYQGGVTNGTTVNDGGALLISSGGAANGTAVNGGIVPDNEESGDFAAEFGHMYVDEGGTANNTVVTGGELYVFSGGKANDITVNERAYLEVEAGGSATVITENGGYVEFDEGAIVTFAENTFGDMSITWSATVHSGTVANDITIGEDGRLEIYLNGEANGTIVNEYGELYVYDGGAAYDTTVNDGGYVWADDGGAVDNVIVNEYGYAEIGGGATANDITVNDRGRVSIAAGAVATAITENGGYVEVDDGADATFVANTISIPSLTWAATAHEGTAVDGVTIDEAGELRVYAGGEVKDAIVNEYGELYVAVDGTATGITENGGYVEVADGASATFVENLLSDLTVTGKTSLHTGTVADTTVTVADGGELYLCAGGLITGSLSIAEGGYVWADADGVFDFDISALAPDNAALIDRYDLVDGAPAFTVTITDEQANGTYVLADRVADRFADTTVTVYTDEGEQAGTISIASPLVIPKDQYNARYELAVEDGTLLLKLSGNPDPEVLSVTADVTKPTNGNVTVSATFTGWIFTQQYSLDNATWQDYTDGIVMTDNGKVYFREITPAGRISEVASYTVANIDRIPPAAPSDPKADVTKPTNKDVTVTVTFSDDSAVREYSFDNKTWKTYTTGAVLTDNGKVYFRGTDEAGNVSQVTSYTVSNIDRTPPAKPTDLKADITVRTGKDVTVTAKFSDDSAQKQYSTDNKTWLSYTNGVVFAKNGTAYFRGVDEAGNVSQVTSYTVSNIDNSRVADDKDLTANVDAKQQRTHNTDLDYAGFYTLAGNFAGMDGSVTIVGSGKKVASGKIRKGVLTFNKGKDALLDGKGSYQIVVRNTGKTGTTYTMRLSSTELFTRGDNTDDTWKNAKTLATGKATNDWVGYGDAVDYYKLGVDANGGFYDLSVSGVKNPVKLTIYSAQGKKVKTVTVSAKKPAAALANLCLDNGSCAVIEAPKAGKAQNSDYTLKLTEKATFTGAKNNDWRGAEVLEKGATFTGVLTKAAGGDVVDYCDVSKIDKLTFDMTAGKTKVSFYDASYNRIRVSGITMADGSVIDASSLTLAAGNGKTDHFSLAAIDDAVKYLKIEASDKKLDGYTITKIA